MYSKNGTGEIGFASPFGIHEQILFDKQLSDYIYLWTRDNLDDKSHRIMNFSIRENHLCFSERIIGRYKRKEGPTVTDTIQKQHF